MPSWTPVHTWVVGEDTTAALMNAQVRDNTDFLHSVPSCQVYNSANISIANATLTALTFNSERYDTDTMHSTASNQSRIVFTTAGKYLVGGTVDWASNATGGRSLGIRLNGTTFIVYETLNAFTGGNHGMSVARTYQFSAADYVELIVLQSSTIALNCQATGNFSPEFGATWQAT